MLEVYHLKDKVVSYIILGMVQAGKEVEISTKGIKQRKKGDEQKHVKKMIHIEFWWTSTCYDIVLVSYSSKHPWWVSYRSDESWIYSVMLAIAEETGQPPYRGS